ncbi:MAG: hypothetical protein QOI01_4519 [Mycobacterium sp.]|jgi:transcriptional regulator with XRE-family HTH domain|nr:hypothetical protein [Mycobacterium sp.]
MVGKEPETGPTARTVAENIKHLRGLGNMNYTELSEQLQILGRSINAVGVRRTESGERRVTPDDLLAFAVALNVSPASLLMPDLPKVAQGDLVQISGWHVPIPAQHVWRWLTGTRPLVGDKLGTFIDRALPSWEREQQYTAEEQRRIQRHDQVLDELQGGGRRRKTDGDD